MAFLLLQAGFLLLPGYLLAVILRIRENRFLFAPALSYLVFIAPLIVARQGQWEPSRFLLVYGAIVFLLLVVAIASRIRAGQGDREEVAVIDYRVPGFCILIASLYLLYQVIVGAYTEVPADLLRHLEFSKVYLRALETGHLGAAQSILKLANQGGGFWYSMYAMATWLSGQQLVETVEAAMWLNTTLFLVAVFLYAIRLFVVLPLSDRQRGVAAFLAVLLVFAQMGIDAFSYVRYYSIAPGMVNFIGFFAAMVCLMHIAEKGGARLGYAILLAVMVVVTGLVHTQEALYILVMVVLYIAWAPVERIWRLHRQGMAAMVPALFVLLLVALSAVLVVVAVRQYLPLNEIRHGTVVALPFSLPGFGALLVLNPGHQFVMVVTLWGALVYLLFFFNFTFFRSQPLLIAGMLSPLLTVFNPLFVDMFIRLDDSTTLWRLCYLVPLHFVAAAVVVHQAARFRHYSPLPRAAVVVALAAVPLLLLPAIGQVPLNRYARTTLAPVPPANSYHHWMDMVEFLNTLKRRHRVLTDPVSGYVISALTPHKTFRYKFFASSYWHKHPFVFDSYEDFPLDRYPGWLLVVNLRDGAPSETGALSHHWPETIMQVKGYYPQELLAHLQNHPDRFRLLWQQDGIEVYRVRDPRS